MSDRELLEQIDACRPGSDDINSPELANLAARVEVDRDDRRRYELVQQLDASLQDAIDDVPVPAGLADRLLAKLAAARGASEHPGGMRTPLQQALPQALESALASGNAVAQTVPTESPTDAPVAPSQTARPSSRRKWLAAAMLAAAASVAAIALTLNWNGRTRLTAANVVEQSVKFYIEDEPGTLMPLSQSPSQTLPLSSKIQFPRTTQWRKVPNFLGDRRLEAVAYEAQIGPATATLYVARYSADLGLPSAPAWTPPYNTAGRVASAWQNGPLLYVLVVEGGTEQYRSLIRKGSFA
jgi:hypothetical protein